jgi:hypothetical protein
VKQFKQQWTLHPDQDLKKVYAEASKVMTPILNKMSKDAWAEVDRRLVDDITSMIEYEQNKKDKENYE